MRKAIVLLSGGLDSSTCAAIAKAEGYSLYALTFDYGQRHDKELIAAKQVAEYYDCVEQKIIKIDLRLWGGSALTDDIEIPKSDILPEHLEEGIPITYVPARNTIFLAFALSYAEAIKANIIFAGMNYIDYSGYPDCRPEYIAKFNELAKLATKAGVEEGTAIRVEAPLLYMTKSEIIRKGLELDFDYSLTWSCYEGEEKACGHCDSCLLRLKGFEEIGIKDPLEYN